MEVARSLNERFLRALPRGPGDFALQLAIWLGFGLLYQVARGVADRGAAEAFANGQLIIDAERSLQAFFETDVQRIVLGSGDVLIQLLNWTYWNSQFTAIGLALLWVYFKRNDSFLRLRNTLLLANTIGLIGFMAMPTAPPRFYPELGFVDTLAGESGLNHGSSLVSLASNQFAAMPSLHSADALILGIAMFALVRTPIAKVLWLMWPAWVWFTVIATGNHYWLDVAAGVALALLAIWLVVYLERRLGSRREPLHGAAVG